MATLEDLEARAAALEAAGADYRAVLAAVNALGANQRDHSERVGRVDTRLDRVDSTLDGVESKLDDTNIRVRSLEDRAGDIKELLVRALER